jgi:hypothetical protein
MPDYNFNEAITISENYINNLLVRMSEKKGKLKDRNKNHGYSVAIRDVQMYFRKMKEAHRGFEFYQGE